MVEQWLTSEQVELLLEEKEKKEGLWEFLTQFPAWTGYDESKVDGAVQEIQHIVHSDK